MSPLTDLRMGTIVVRGDGNQGRLWEAGTRSKVALCISVEGFDGSLLRSSAVLPTGSVLFLAPPPLSLLTPPHMYPCSAPCLLLTQSSRPCHFVSHMAFQGTASAHKIDLQSHFLETKFCLNTEECVLQRSPRQSKVKNPFGKQTRPVHGISHFDVPLSSTRVYSKSSHLERSR